MYILSGPTIINDVITNKFTYQTPLKRCMSENNGFVHLS